MTWQDILRHNITSWETLCAVLNLELTETKKVNFPLNLPLRLAHKIEKGNLDDPILKQFVPHAEENETHPLYVMDPVGDHFSRCAPKSLKKYAQRILLVTTQACAMHCRYCFRQNFAYAKQKGYEEELTLIKNDLTLREVILSGGDPLSLSDRMLKELIEKLSNISHLKRLRFHTRFPIGIPERITPSFLEILSACSLQTWFVIQCNHPRELDADVLHALKSIQKLGIPVLNQAVLLRGVNDTLDVLQELCEKLADNGIQPYYLHQLDRVQGTAHFEVAQEKGLRLVKELRERLSGYAIPTYVQEIHGENSKSVLT